MADRTLEDALAHAEEIRAYLAGQSPTPIFYTEDIVLLADEVKRLRAGNPHPVCPHIPSHEDCPDPLIITDCEGHEP